MSFFGRVNYDYQSKYLVSLVLRSDGYSKLPSNNRWGVFPGISAGWVISREKFMENITPILSYAKIRASYGANGNVSGITDANGNIINGLDYYTVQGAYNIVKNKNNVTVPNYNGKVPITLTDLPNPMMKWEKLHRRSRAHPPSCSFEKALPCQAAECRAALPCGLGLYPAKSGHRADTGAAAYWVSNNLKWHSPPCLSYDHLSG
jgi:hypothetical protein